MNYLGNLGNLVRDAELSATGIVPSEAIERTDMVAKNGGGDVVLVGPYAGGATTTIDVEIVDNASATTVVSQPTFTGAGNGAISDVAATGLDAQEFVITLEDLGTDTRAATAPFQTATLVASVGGAGGNATTVAISEEGISASPTDFSLRDDLRAGVNEYVGDHWSFGAAMLTDAGEVPDTAPRVRFGADPQVYRAYRFRREGAFVYGFSPSPVRDVSRGARVAAVSGARSIVIRRDATVETITGIVTLFDALSAIRDQSALVTVSGVIVNDKLPGGQGAVDLSVQTQAYAAFVDADGTDAIQQADIGLTVEPDAPTETLSITCIGNSGGFDQFRVRGDVSTNLPNAIAGVLYEAGAYRFLIPPPPVDPTSNGAEMIVEFIPVDRGVSTPAPSMCVVMPVIGARAANGEATFVYRLKPPPPCDCDTGTLVGGPIADCLGVEPDGGNVATATNAQRYRSVRIDRWYGEMMRAVTIYLADDGQMRRGEPARLILTPARSLVQSALKAIAAGVEADPPSTWATAKAKAQYDIVTPAVRDGFLYRARNRGTTGATEPTFPAEIGATVTDNGIVWECFAREALDEFDAAFDRVKSELMSIHPARHRSWAALQAIDLATSPVTLIPTTSTGHYYQLVRSGTTGGTEPAWPVDGTTIADGTAIWQDMGAYWNAAAEVAEGVIVVPTAGAAYECITPGATDGTTEPAWDAINIDDGTVKWRRIAMQSVPVRESADEGIAAGDVQRRADYLAALNAYFAEAFALAGVNANFDPASTFGGECWLSDKSPGHFVHDNYLPITPGLYYHFCELVMGPDGVPTAQSTQEGGFGPKFCGALVSGDSIRVRWRGINGVTSGYQQGDSITAAITHAGPVEFGGGQAGTDTLTWSVIGSLEGRLDDYALLKSAPPLYSDSGLEFRITPGGLPHALGDRFRVSLEGGRFRWRRDGGAWSASPIDVGGDVPLADGLVARFVRGAAPAWVAGDRWSFRAESIHGVDQLRRPTPERMTWIGPTTIDATPAEATTIDAVLIADHSIPSGAVILLEGSDDDFATTPLSVAVPWRERHIYQRIATSTHARYRLSVSTSGSIMWLRLGREFVPRIQRGDTERGVVTKSIRMPTRLQRRGFGCSIAHVWLPQAQVDALLDVLAHATEFDDGRLAVVPNELESEVGVVRYNGDPVEITDARGFGPIDVARRRLNVSLTLEATP